MLPVRGIEALLRLLSDWDDEQEIGKTQLFVAFGLAILSFRPLEVLRWPPA